MSTASARKRSTPLFVVISEKTRIPYQRAESISFSLALCVAGVINRPTAWDGYLAAITADALVRAQKSGAIEEIKPAQEKPAFYN